MKKKKRTDCRNCHLNPAVHWSRGFISEHEPAASEGEKHITVTVIHGDQTENVFEFEHRCKISWRSFKKARISWNGESGEYGLFITTVDEETADDSKQQWWCITKGGEQVNTSADQTPVSDGDAFELTLKEGY